MNKESGSQVSTLDILAGSANAHNGPAELFGVEVKLINGTITKRDLLNVMRVKLGLQDRQPRAAVSSYIARGKTDHAPGTRPGINAGIARVSSAACEIQELADRRDDARVENGAKGGRPSK